MQKTTPNYIRISITPPPGFFGTKEPVLESHYLVIIWKIVFNFKTILSFKDIPDVSYFCEELEQ